MELFSFWDFRFKPEKKLFPKKEFRVDKKKVLGIDLRNRYYIKEAETCLFCELAISGNVVTITQSGQTNQMMSIS